MDKEEFIKVIKTEVCDSAIESTIDNLIHPPGRNPSVELLEQSDFYKRLSVKEKQIVNSIISESVRESIFGFLCVLDGVRKITDSNRIGRIELSYLSNSNKMLLNDSEKEYLHDIFNRT